MLRRAMAVVAAGAMSVSGAHGQQGDPAGVPPPAAAQKPPVQPEKREMELAPSQITIIAKPTLVKRGPDDKVIRLEGNMDVHALRANRRVSKEQLEEMRPIVEEWALNIDQLVIDNLDFCEKIHDGLLEKINPTDPKSTGPLVLMFEQLMGVGALSKYLTDAGVLNRLQERENMEMIAEYQQAVVLELGPTPDQNLSNEEIETMFKQVSRFMFESSCQDAMASFHRQLAGLADRMEKVIAKADLTEEQRAAMRAAARGLSSTTDPVERTRIAAAALATVKDFAARRGVLQTSLEMAPKVDVYEVLLAPDEAMSAGR